MHLEPEHSPEVCLEPGTCTSVSAVKSKYVVFGPVKEIPLPPSYMCSSSLPARKQTALGREANVSSSIGWLDNSVARKSKYLLRVPLST